MGYCEGKNHLMSSSSTKTIELIEYKPIVLSKEELPDEIGEFLWKKYGKNVNVEFPSPKTNNSWQLTSQGFVGYIPLTEKFHFSLQPKVSLYNLFRMWEYAYKLESYEVLPGLMKAESLIEFYEHLANILAKQVLDRSRKGFYRSYLNKTEQLACIRGRLDLRKALQRPWDANLICYYEEHTPDIEENQILAWTLYRIAHSGVCTGRVLPILRRAYHSLIGLTTLVPFDASACIGRLYNRLNEDYKKLHALCLFFLEQSGPSHKIGDHIFLPFLVDMAFLYERFVAEWLRLNMPKGLMLESKEHLKIGKGEIIEFEIDLVIYDEKTNAPLYVLDTKYKIPESIDHADFNQIVVYAEAKGCKEAILVYPSLVPKPLDERIGDIHVRNITFSLDGNLKAAGSAFLKELNYQ